MKVYTCHFKGHYPVGACAVVVAKDLATAKFLLEQALKTEGLDQVIPESKLEPVDLKTEGVNILNNGDY